jgi:hypothetical protein
MRAEAPKQPVIVGGLCMSCSHRPMCMYLRDAKSPIMQCEEYDDFVRPTASVQAAVTLTAPAAEAVELTGLCRNCERRASCMHLKTGQVFLNCEDYE